ncbi:cytochrome P450 [Streptomyces sp. NPDC053750]|uniref:cytochrome P450 n=1 Tax=Streptomyces sp. NPDC053750 TaxID=3365714 RepID=UPI0037D87411
MNVHSAPVPPPGCPAHDPGGRVPLYGPDFAADPQAYYDYLRHYGPTAPVELAPGVEATLVTDYTAALNLLRDPAFRKDARQWRDLHSGKVPEDSPVVPLLAYRPNCMFADGAEHQRLRQAVTESMTRIDSRHLAQITEQVSAYLIAQFSARGSADLMADYAGQLPLFVFNELFGCPAEIGDRVLFGISGMFDGVNAAESAQLLHGAVGELVSLKRDRPGDDVTSWLMEHEADLTDDEMVHQLSLLLGAGAEPLRNLIGNTLHRVLTHDRGAYQDVRNAINDTLWKNPPIANFAAHYPADDRMYAGRQVSAGQLMMVSFAAANTGMAQTEDHHAANRASLAWSAGPHACPSQRPATGITVTAVDNLLGRLPDIELAVPAHLLTWRPGPFHRALSALPVRFGAVQAVGRPTAPVSPQHTTTRAEHPAEQRRAGGPGKWTQFLAWLRK